MQQPNLPMMSWATPLSNWAVHLAALRLSAVGSPALKSARLAQRLRTVWQLLVMQFFVVAVAGQLWSWLIPAACIWITRSWVLGAAVARCVPPAPLPCQPAPAAADATSRLPCSYYAYIWSPVGRRVAETDGWWPQPLKRCCDGPACGDLVALVAVHGCRWCRMPSQHAAPACAAVCAWRVQLGSPLLTTTWGRRLFLWRELSEYFQARLVKTADLDPAGTYIFACAPHGKLALRRAPA
jgi:hypothetical protein